MTWFLDLRAQASGGGVARDVTVYADDVLSPIGALQTAIRNREVLFATHGFNVNRVDGRNALKCWEQWLFLPPQAIYIAVLWPGDSAWIPAVDYPIEGNEAIGSGNLLATFTMANLLGAAAFSFASHSLGARVVLQAIRGISSAVRVRCLMLMAGAIDDNCLNNEYADASQAVEKISVLASEHDQVLALAFPAGNFFAGIATKGSPYWHGALGREGPQTTLGGKVQWDWNIPDPWRYGHHHYLAQHVPLPAWNRPPLPQQLPASSPDRPSWGNFDEWRAAWSAAMLSSLLR